MSSTITWGTTAHASTAEDGDQETHDLFLSAGGDGDYSDSIPIKKDPADGSRYLPTERVTVTDERLPEETRDRLLAHLRRIGDISQEATQKWSLTYVPSVYEGSRLGVKEQPWPLHFANGPLESKGESIPDGDAMDLD